MKASRMIDRGEHGDRRKAGHVCPFVDEPRVDCYCFNMNSQNIPKAVKYCGCDFIKCEIYQSIMSKSIQLAVSR